MSIEHQIGLALGGGGARGLAHIPVCEAFDELGLKPATIAGTSIGAIIGVGYAAGMSGREMREQAVDFYSNKREVLTRLWKIRPLAFSDILRGRFLSTQFDTHQALENFVPGIESIPENFADLKIPLKIVSSDFYGWTETVIESGLIRPALAASVAIPSIFKPVLVNGRIQVDGGTINPLPYDHLLSHEVIVASDVAGGPTGDPDRMPSFLETIVGASQVSMQAIVAEKLKWHQPDIMIRPKVNGIFVLDFMKAKVILEQNTGLKDDVKRRLDHLINSPLEQMVLDNGDDRRLAPIGEEHAQ